MALPPYRKILLTALLPVAFLVSCAGLLAPASRLVDPMTHRPLKAKEYWPFPALVIHQDGPQLLMVESFDEIPQIPQASTYLIPIQSKAAIQDYLQDENPPGTDASWALDVNETGPGRQRIELYLLGDGYFGGVYEATRNTVTPLYRKVTGPGFALVFAGLALAMNLALWGAAAVLFALLRRRSRTS